MAKDADAAGWGKPIGDCQRYPLPALDPVDPIHLATFREIVSERFPLLKIGRFDPDKRWMSAAEAVERLKGLGVPVLWLMRGGMEPHGRDAGLFRDKGFRWPPSPLPPADQPWKNAWN